MTASRFYLPAAWRSHCRSRPQSYPSLFCHYISELLFSFEDVYTSWLSFIVIDIGGEHTTDFTGSSHGGCVDLTRPMT